MAKIIASVNTRTLLGVTHSPVPFDVPRGACDCHTHVFGPATRFPYWQGRVYTPPDASIADLEKLHRLLGIDRVVIVHPSPYGTDNAASLDAIRQIGASARGVAVIDEARITDIELEALHAGGMRGARVNLQTAGISDPAVARQRLSATAARVAPLGWHVQAFTTLDMIAAIADVVAALAAPLVVDHFGRAEARLGIAQRGFHVLTELLAAGNTFVKLSAAYRCSDRADRADVDELAQALVAANAKACVWGTDWPHPGGGARGRAEHEMIEPFQPIDDGAALGMLARWVPDLETRHAVLVDTPARLYGFPAV